MIQSFYDRGTEDIFNRIGSKEARRTCPDRVWKIAGRKLDQLNAAVSLGSLRIPPGNRLEGLKETVKDNIASGSTTSFEYVSSGLTKVRNGSRLRTIIKRILGKPH